LWTRERIVEDLRELRVAAGDTLLIHASLRAIGRVDGAVDAVIEALAEVVGPDGTLVVAAFNRRNRVPNCDDWSGGFTEGVCRDQVKTLAERIAAHPNAAVSQHPTHAFAAIGRNAEFLTASAPFHYPLGANSPLARLHQIDARILLLGVDHRANASLYLAEHWADAPYARRHARVVTADREVVEMEGGPECSEGFARIEPLLRQARILKTGYVGNAPSQSMRMRHVVSMAMEMLRGDSESLLCADPRCVPCVSARRFTARQISDAPGIGL
jgi:aminoglycoside 3-N-acetyltransferase